MAGRIPAASATWKLRRSTARAVRWCGVSGRTPQATGLYLPADHFAGSFFRALREAGRVPGEDFDAVLGNYNPVIYHNLDHSPAAIDVNLPLLVRKVSRPLASAHMQNRDIAGRVGNTRSPRLFAPGDGRRPQCLE